jgi:broad specificity phosphatase PhoE
MKIGLVRHFRVEHRPQRFWLTGKQFDHWVVEYEAAPIGNAEYDDGGQQWDRCLCSDQARAVHTARHIYPQEIVYTELLREVGVAALQLRRFKLPGLRLPLKAWLILCRLSWILGHPSQPESKRTVLERASKVIDSLEAEADRDSQSVLLVSHGGFMTTLDRELRRRGYRAERMGHPRNGQLYLYEQE